MKRYAYCRVSAKDQNPERQILAMLEQQIRKKDIYLDKTSGQDFSRPEYIKLLKTLKKGDVFVVKSIDRLGRNYGEILERWRNTLVLIALESACGIFLLGYFLIAVVRKTLR